MSSKMEQIIGEIEDFIDGCKYQPLSNTKIIVNKEELEELIAELREKTPEEVKRYQKIISNKEAILADAQANHVQDSRIETIFLTSDLSYSYLSSTIVKEFASYGGDISNFVPERFVERIYKKYENR